MDGKMLQLLGRHISPEFGVKHENISLAYEHKLQDF